jgi:hypothetical protein
MPKVGYQFALDNAFIRNGIQGRHRPAVRLVKIGTPVLWSRHLRVHRFRARGVKTRTAHLISLRLGSTIASGDVALCEFFCLKFKKSKWTNGDVGLLQVRTQPPQPRRI